MEKFRVGIIGATGMVGQRFVLLTANHPWFTPVVLAASAHSAGKTYAQAIEGKWHMAEPIPESVKSMIVMDAEADAEEIARQVDFVFCAVNMKKDEIKALEEKNDGKFDYTYNERMVILPYTIQLLRSDSDTRKAVLPIFNGNGEDDTLYYHGNKRIPCSMYYDFLIRENSKREKVLHICYHQRSSDFVTHFGNDVYLAWRLMEYVAKEVGVKPGYLYHTIDSLHTYQKDWDKLASSLRVFEDTII